MKRTLIFAALTAAFVGSLLFAPAASAYDIFGGNSAQAPCKQDAAKSSTLCSTNGSDPIAGKDGVIHKAVIIISTISGAVAVIMIIVGGFMYVLSNGDSGKIKSARDTIVYASVGLVVIAMSQTILIFVIDRIK